MSSLAEKFKNMTPAMKGAASLGVAVVMAGLIILILWLAGVIFKSADSTTNPPAVTDTAKPASETVTEVTPTPTPTPTPIVV